MKALKRTAIIAAMSALAASPAIAHEGHSHGTPIGLISAITAIGGAVIYWAWKHNA